MATTNPNAQGGGGLTPMPSAPVSSSPFTHPVDGPAPMQGPVVQRGGGASLSRPASSGSSGGGSVADWQRHYNATHGGVDLAVDGIAGPLTIAKGYKLSGAVSPSAASSGAGKGLGSGEAVGAGLGGHGAVYDAIKRAAAENGVPLNLALAMAQQESGFNPNVFGDQGTSIGLYQLHRGGELGSMSFEQAKDPYTNASVALKVVGQVLRANPGFSMGQVAAAAQRPTDGAGYAQLINGILGHATSDSSYFQTQLSGAGAFGSGQSYSAAGANAPARMANGTPVGPGESAGGAAFDEKAFERAIAGSGFTSGLINSDASLKAAFRKAVSGRLDNTEFLALIEQTPWWKKRNDYSRQYDEQAFKDPSTFNRKLAVERQSLTAQAGSMGVQLDPKRLDTLARTSLRQNFSPEEIRKSLSGEAKYNPNATAGGGQVGQVVDQIKQKATEYFADASPATIQSLLRTVMGKQTADGQPDLKMVDDYFKNIAQSKFPWLKQQLDQGFTVSQLADPYKQEIGKTLEVDPTTIKNNDPTLLRGLQYQDPANVKAGYTTQPLYSFQDMLRKDPRWMKTNNARDSLMDQGTSVLKDFGLMT